MEGQLRKIIAQNAGVPFTDVEDEKTLSELGADEFDVVEIILELEEWVEHDLSDERITLNSTVKDVIDYTIAEKGESNDSQESSGGSGEA